MTKVDDKLRKLKKEVLDRCMDIFIPTEKQIIAKAQLWGKSQNEGKSPKDYSKFVEIPAMTDFGKSTWQLWFAQDGFELWVYDKEDFQNWIDDRATSMARRLWDLAFKEKGNAAVSAAKAFLELSSFKKQRIEVKDEYDSMSDGQLIQEMARLEKEAKNGG